MFIALDKLENQGLKKAIIAVPERSIGGSFDSTPLSKHGFFSDWTVPPQHNLCTPGGDAGKVSAFKDFLAGDGRILICTHATLRRKRSTEPLSHFCQSSGGYGIYATRLSIV